MLQGLQYELQTANTLS